MRSFNPVEVFVDGPQRPVMGFPGCRCSTANREETGDSQRDILSAKFRNIRAEILIGFVVVWNLRDVGPVGADSEGTHQSRTDDPGVSKGHPVDQIVQAVVRDRQRISSVEGGALAQLRRQYAPVELMLR